MNMNKEHKLLILFTMISFMVFIGVANADSGPPSTQTTFYFQNNGSPITQPVKFTATCYGTNPMTTGDKLLKISEFSEICQNYGCQFDTSNIFEVYRGNIKYCDLSGEVNTEKFAISNFLVASEDSSSMAGLKCHGLGYDTAIFSAAGNKYYKTTQKYEDCQSNVYREYYPSGGGDVKGEFLCAKYEADEYLIPTSIPITPNGDCYRYGYTIKDGICYKISDEFFNCTRKEEAKMDLCNQYLDDVTSKLAKDKNGYAFERICEVNVSISNNQPTQNQGAQSVKPIEKPQPKNMFFGIMDFFRCFFPKLFGKSC
jgi:hypothetical protein